MYQSNQHVNSVTPSCETCGGPHSYYECQAASGYTQDIYATTRNYNAGGNSYQPQATSVIEIKKSLQERPQGALPSNTIPNPREEIKAITTRSGNVLAGPSVPSPPSSSSKEVERDLETNTDQVLTESTTRVPPLEVQSSPASRPSELPLAPTLSSVIPGCSRNLEICMALAGLGASINLMPLSIWKKFMLLELVPTRKLTFLADFVVVDYHVDPRFPLILGRPFLRMARALVEVYGEKLILRDGDEKLIFHADSTSNNPYKHGDESINMINFIDITCEDHFNEVLNVQKSIHPLSGSPTPSFNPVETDTFLSLDDSIPPGIDNGIYDSEGDILFLEELLKDEPSETKRSEIYTLIGEPPDIFLMRDEEIKFNPLKDIDDPVPILKVSETPLDSFDSSLDSFDTAFTNPLFKLNYEYTLNYDNPIFDIQNENSDASKTETIMDEVQIDSLHSTAQILPLFESLILDMTMHDIIMYQIRHGMVHSSCLSFYLGLLFPKGVSESHSLDSFELGDENLVFDPGAIITKGWIEHYHGGDIPASDVLDLHFFPIDNGASPASDSLINKLL
ncbi:hypothetical protein Tco_0499522 [Tanacetum coccineum]